MANIEQIRFTTRVLGPLAAFRLQQHQVTQTLRSDSDSIAASILNGEAKAGDRLYIFLDGIMLDDAELVSVDVVYWEGINLDDAHRGGFNSLKELEAALKRAGFRFKPLNRYELYRIQFTWLEGEYA